ncbi:MAG: DNA cytosine methyltransferase [Dehalococcoidia bacterium]
MRELRAAEFFAGIGLVRAALERTGWRVVFANDIEPFKHAIYRANFDASDFVLGDVRAIRGRDVPDIELATASFPCTDLSLAGMRRGLDGQQSGMLWEFTRILDEMGPRRPEAVLLENVPSFGTSKGGADFVAAVRRLNLLGYECNVTIGDARAFVPQSRQRMFIIGTQGAGKLQAMRATLPGFEDVPSNQPPWLRRFAADHPDLRLRVFDLDAPPPTSMTLADVVDRLPRNDSRWWDGERLARFVDSLSPRQASRLETLRQGRRTTWATAYRRTRLQHATWEIRSDSISGCLRTARGGSSRQALVEAGRGEVSVRWMTAREYARLQGAPDFSIPGTVSENQALSGFGDAVALPVVEWLSRFYLTPAVLGTARRRRSATVSVSS